MAELSKNQGDQWREVTVVCTLIISVLLSWSVTLLFSPKAQTLLSEVPGAVKVESFLGKFLTRPTIYEEDSKLDSK